MTTTELKRLYPHDRLPHDAVIVTVRRALGRMVADVAAVEVIADFPLPVPAALKAAEALRLTAQDLLKLGVIDRVVAEPVGGAHRGRSDAIAAMGKALGAMLDELSGRKPAALIAERRQKFLTMGARGLAA